MYKSTVKRVTYPKKFIRGERKWCYHFFHVKMRMMLSFGKGQKTAIQKCTNSFFGGVNVHNEGRNVHNEVENVHFHLISPSKKWTFTLFCPFPLRENEHLHFSGSHLRCENVHLHFPAHTQVREWAFQPLARKPTWLPCFKIDWKFRVIPLNWSWQQTCSRRMNIYIFPQLTSPAREWTFTFSHQHQNRLKI